MMSLDVNGKNLSTEESDWEINSSSESSEDENENEQILHQTVVLKRPPQNETINKKEFIDQKEKPVESTLGDVKKDSITPVLEKAKKEKESEPKEEILNAKTQILPTTTIKKIKKVKTNSESENTSSTSLDRDCDDYKAKSKVTSKPKKKLKSSELKTKRDENDEKSSEKTVVKKIKKTKSEGLNKEVSSSTDNLKSEDGKTTKVKVIKKKAVKTSDQIADSPKAESKSKKPSKKNLTVESKGEKTKLKGKKSESMENVSDSVENAKNEIAENKKVKAKKEVADVAKLPPPETDLDNKDDLEKFIDSGVKNLKDDTKTYLNDISPNENKVERIVVETPATSNEPNTEKIKDTQNVEKENSQISSEEPKILNTSENHFLHLKNEIKEPEKEIDDITIGNELTKPDVEDVGITNRSEVSKDEALDGLDLEYKFEKQETKDDYIENKCALKKTEATLDLSIDLETNLDQWMKDLLARHNIKRETLQTDDIADANETQAADNDNAGPKPKEFSDLKDSLSLKDKIKEAENTNDTLNSRNLSTEALKKHEGHLMRNKNDFNDEFEDDLINNILNKKLERSDKKENLSKEFDDSEIEKKSFDYKKFSPRNKDFDNDDDEINFLSKYQSKKNDNYTENDMGNELKWSKSKKQNLQSKQTMSTDYDHEKEDVWDKEEDKHFHYEKNYDRDAKSEEESFMARFRREKYSKVSSRRNKTHQPRNKENSDEKIKEKTKHIKALIDKQQSVVENLKTLSKKLSELDSLIDEAESESRDQKAIFENLEYALDSAYNQYEIDFKNATEQANQPRKVNKEDLKDEINDILNDILMYTRNPTSKYDDYLSKKLAEPSRTSKYFPEEIDSMPLKPSSNTSWNFESSKNWTPRNSIASGDDRMAYNPSRRKSLTNHENNITGAKKRETKSQASENYGDLTTMSVTDFIDKIKNKYAIQPSSQPTWKDRNSPYSRSSISDFSALESKYGKLNTDNFDKIPNKRNSLTKSYDEGSETTYKYVPKKYFNEDSSFAKKENNFQTSGSGFGIKSEKNGGASFYRSKFLNSATGYQGH